MGIYDQLGICGKMVLVGGGSRGIEQISDSERCVLRARPPLRAYIQYNLYVYIYENVQ